MDLYGLLFGSNGTEINIWGNGPGSYEFGASDVNGINTLNSNGTATAHVDDVSLAYTGATFSDANASTGKTVTLQGSLPDWGRRRQLQPGGLADHHHGRHHADHCYCVGGRRSESRL